MDFFSFSPDKLPPRPVDDLPTPAVAGSANSTSRRPSLPRQRAYSAQLSTSKHRPIPTHPQTSSALLSPFQEPRARTLSMASHRAASANAPTVGRQARTRSLHSHRTQPYPVVMSSEPGSPARTPLQPVQDAPTSPILAQATPFSSPLAASTPKATTPVYIVEDSPMTVDDTLPAFASFQINPSLHSPARPAPDIRLSKPLQSTPSLAQATATRTVKHTYSKHGKTKRTSERTSEADDLHEIFTGLDLGDKEKWTMTAAAPPKPLGEHAAKVKSKDRLLKGISRVEAKSKLPAQKRIKTSVLGTPVVTSTPKPKHSKKENRVRDSARQPASPAVGSRRYAVKSIQGAFVRMRIEEKPPQTENDSDDEIAAW